jgi:hypothetical protein
MPDSQKETTAEKVHRLHEEYRSTGKGFMWEMARVPGEMAAVFGLFSGNAPVALAGVAEVGIVLHYDAKAEDAFFEQHRNDPAPAPAA